MAASAWRVYNEAKKYLLDDTIPLSTAAIRMKLVKGTDAATVSNYTRSSFASSTGTAITVSGNTTVRTPGSIVILSVNASTYALDSADVVFTMSAQKTSILYAVLGVSAGKAIAWCKLTTTGTITVNAGSTLTVTIHANGYFTLSGGTV